MTSLFLAKTFYGLNLLLQSSAGTGDKNLNFLFAGFAVVWLLLLGYVFSLMRRQKRLEAEVEMLKQMRQEK